MEVVLQKDLFERSERVFYNASKKHDIKFYLTDILDEDAMLAYHKKGVNCFVIGAEAYSKRFYENLSKGSSVIRYGVGYNAVPIEICRERNIEVGYTPGTLTESVAEHVFAILLSVVRKIPELHQSVLTGNWMGVPGIELKNKTIAIIGFGSIGQAVAKIAKFGFGMKVNAFDIRKKNNQDLYDFFSDSFKKVSQNADVLSLHMSTSKENNHFINQEKIQMMKDGVIFINTARGELVNELDLYAGLQSGKIAAAGLDVFTNEPYKPYQNADFRKLKNVVLTPHCSSNTKESNDRMAELTIKNILSYYTGGEMVLIPELKSY